MNELVICSAAFVVSGCIPGRSSISSAAAPLTNAAAMLVPEPQM